MPATVLLDRSRDEIHDSIYESIQTLFEEKGLSDALLLDEIVDCALAGVECAGVQFVKSGWPTYNINAQGARRR